MFISNKSPETSRSPSSSETVAVVGEVSGMGSKHWQVTGLLRMSGLDNRSMKGCKYTSDPDMNRYKSRSHVWG